MTEFNLGHKDLNQLMRINLSGICFKLPNRARRNAIKSMTFPQTCTITYSCDIYATLQIVDVTIILSLWEVAVETVTAHCWDLGGLFVAKIDHQIHPSKLSYNHVPYLIKAGAI